MYELKEFRKKISTLRKDELEARDLYLRRLSAGIVLGPPTGFPEIDKPWLGVYEAEEILEDTPEKTIWQYTKECLGEENDLKILNYYGAIVTWGELKQKVREVAGRLVNCFNVKKGEIVSLCLPTIPEAVYLFFALNSIGAVVNMIDPRINAERIKDCIGKDCRLVFTVDTYNKKIDMVTRELGIDHVVSVSPADSLTSIKRLLYQSKVKIDSVSRFLLWKAFIKQSAVSEVEEVVECRNQPAVIVYTSGTTGIPKGVMLSNDGINAVCFQQKKVLPDMKKGDTFLDIMPIFVAYGLVCGICASISTGLYLTLVPKFEPQEFGTLVLKHKPNHIIGVPMFFESLIKRAIVGYKSLSFIKYCIAGGDKLTIESEEKINEFLKKHGVKNRIIKGYGMTELSSGCVINKADEYNKPGSCGMPMIKNNVKVISLDTGKSITYNQTGEIYLAGPSEMFGYKNNETEEAKVRITDEYGERWIRTGDLGHVDSKGNISIDGRLKNMIIRPDGHNVFPKPIEDLLLTHPAVEECVVIGIASKEYQNGKVPAALVVLKDEYEGKEESILEELKALSLEKLPPRDIALEYKFVKQLL